MGTRATEGYGSLTEKEKQTLRLIVRGHDAKSTARHLDLSVHTINERLRDARRKLAVSSSREAARLVLAKEQEGEGDAPDSLGDMAIGEAAARPRVEQVAMPTSGERRKHRRAWITIGVSLMTLALGLFALTALPHLAPAPTPGPAVAGDARAAEIVESARQFLVLIDQGRWDDSYRATGASFRKLNTSETWAAISQKVRPPLGAVITRTLISQENLPAPPSGYEVVKFRTSFAN